MALNAPTRQLETNADGKRVTVRLSPETYAGLIVLKLRDGVSLERLVEAACADFVRRGVEGEGASR